MAFLPSSSYQIEKKNIAFGSGQPNALQRPTQKS